MTARLAATRRRRRRRHPFDTVAIALCGGGAALLALISLAVAALLLAGGMPTLLKGVTPIGGLASGLSHSLLPAAIGNAAVVIVMVLFSVPFGVLTAVYLAEYAPVNAPATRAVRLAVRNLAGVPSVVFGLFGLGFFVRVVGIGIDRTFFAGNLVFGQPGILWAGLTLSILTLPTVIVTAEEALRAVPGEVRDAAVALGATRWQTVSRVVLPQAVPGVLTGIIISVARGAGEVAPVLFTGAAYFLPALPRFLSDQFMHLGYQVFVLATQAPNVDAARPLLLATSLVLVALTAGLNLAAMWIRLRARRSSQT
jgi:phosphate transport system permease protein